MRSALAVLFLFAVSAPAFATDEYVVAHIQCPSVFAVVNFVDKAGSDPEFHVDNDGPKVFLAPLKIQRTAPQVITCTYTKLDAQNDNVFKVNYSYKVKRTIMGCSPSTQISLDCKLKP